MGIYGALATAVSGLRAQSHAMENISGNIANSQTTGYKRIETSFIDLLPDAPVKSQVPGAVTSYSRSTNSDRGDIQNATTETFMALNGSGFFVVEPSFGDTSGTYYTRRGDFDIDKNGYLVNGAGYRLKGLAMENGVVTGSVASPVQIDNSFMPARRTSSVDYQLNLPQVPKNPSYSATAPGSELMQNTDYLNSGAYVASRTGAAAPSGAALANTFITATGQTMNVTIGGTTTQLVFDTDGTVTPGAGVYEIDAQAPATIDDILADIQAVLRANGGPGASNVTVSRTGAPVSINVSVDGNYTDSLSIAGTATGLGLNTGAPVTPFAGTVPDTILAADADDFMSQTITGGGITVYSSTGEPINVQLRWAKNDNTLPTEQWSLYYASETGTAATVPWTKLGTYSFTQGVLTGLAPVAGVTTSSGTDNLLINNLQVNGSSVGAVTINHGLKGVTQFADNSGAATTTALGQNGYGAGEFISVGVNDKGQIVASYTNGETKEVAQIVTATFNAPNELKRGDGGTYTATSLSGEPILSQDGGIVGSSLEASNTDISEEFTKLNVTQQAYAANTRIVSAADDMLQETLNMIR